MAVDLKEIEELELFFRGIDLPTETYLDSGTRVLSVTEFVKDNISSLRNEGISHLAASTRLWRLQKLKEVLTAQNG